MLAVCLLALLPFIPQTVIDRIGTVGSSISEADLGGRVTMWRLSIAVLAQHPIFGVGGGAIDGMIGGAVHNTFISVATETGFIGFVLFLSILGYIVFKMAVLPKGTAPLWLTIFLTWAIGVFSLSWEFRKATWIILILIVIEGSFGKQEVATGRPYGFSLKASGGLSESANLYPNQRWSDQGEAGLKLHLISSSFMES